MPVVKLTPQATELRSCWIWEPSESHPCPDQVLVFSWVCSKSSTQALFHVLAKVLPTFEISVSSMLLRIIKRRIKATKQNLQSSFQDSHWLLRLEFCKAGVRDHNRSSVLLHPALSSQLLPLLVFTANALQQGSFCPNHR